MHDTKALPIAFSFCYVRQEIIKDLIFQEGTSMKNLTRIMLITLALYGQAMLAMENMTRAEKLAKIKADAEKRKATAAQAVASSSSSTPVPEAVQATASQTPPPKPQRRTSATQTPPEPTAQPSAAQIAPQKPARTAKILEETARLQAQAATSNSSSSSSSSSSSISISPATMFQDWFKDTSFYTLLEGEEKANAIEDLITHANKDINTGIKRSISANKQVQELFYRSLNQLQKNDNPLKKAQTLFKICFYMALLSQIDSDIKQQAQKRYSTTFNSQDAQKAFKQKFGLNEVPKIDTEFLNNLPLYK
jgi:hypothetical protein